MIPKFSKWIENTEQSEPEQSSSVSEPEHKKGEDLLSLNNLVEKRIKEIIEELEVKGKASEQDVYGAIANLLDKNFKGPQNEKDPNSDSSNNPTTDNSNSTPPDPNLAPAAPMDPNMNSMAPAAPMDPNMTPMAQMS